MRYRDFTKEEINNEPVFYCKTCLSLAIKPYNAHIDYCNDCGSTNVSKTHIELWEHMYAKVHGVKLLDK